MPERPNDASKALGRNLAALREELPMTRRAFAHAAQVDETTYRKFELGTRTPGLSNLIRIREALDVSWDEIFKGLTTSMLEPSTPTAAAISIEQLRKERDARRRANRRK